MYVFSMYVFVLFTASDKKKKIIDEQLPALCHLFSCGDCQHTVSSPSFLQVVT